MRSAFFCGTAIKPTRFLFEGGTLHALLYTLSIVFFIGGIRLYRYNFNINMLHYYSCKCILWHGVCICVSNDVCTGYW